MSDRMEMGRRSIGTLLNVSTKFFYPILIWKRPTGTYSMLFWNDLAQLNGKKKCPRGEAFAHLAGLHVGHLNSFLELWDGNLTAKNRKVQMSGRLRGEGGRNVEVTNWSVH